MGKNITKETNKNKIKIWREIFLTWYSIPSQAIDQMQEQNNDVFRYLISQKQKLLFPCLEHTTGEFASPK